MKYFALSYCLLVGAVSAPAQNMLKPLSLSYPAPTGALKDVGIDQKLNTALPLHLEFKDETGQTVKLGNYFGKRAVILAPVYFQCPMLCSQTLNGLIGSLKGIRFDPGKDYEVIAFSFEPKDTPEAAFSKKQGYMKRYGREGAGQGFHFLTGTEANIEQLTRALGFRYAWDEKSQQWAHASAIIVATADGHTSRYFYGVEYAPRDVKFGLMEASKNKIGTVVEQALLFCYHYDPNTGQYTNVVMGSLRAAAALTILSLGTFLFVMLRRDRRRGEARS